MPNKVNLKARWDDVLQKVDNIVTSWNTPTSDVKYPSEKLVKDSLDNKANTVHIHNFFIDYNDEIINQPTVEMVDITIEIVWIDSTNNGALRPSSLQSACYGGLTKVADIYLSEEEGWTATVTVPKYTQNNEEILYSWQIVSNVTSYRSTTTYLNNVTTFTYRIPSQ